MAAAMTMALEVLDDLQKGLMKVNVQIKIC